MLTRVRPDPVADVRWLMSAATTDLSMTDADQRRELIAAFDRTPVAGAFEAGVPVSFCFAAHETESWWRVAVHTVRAARRRGHARAVASLVIAQYRDQSKSPVWLALDGDVPSQALARRLGLVRRETIRFFMGTR